jgi:hypothetical protein
MRFLFPVSALRLAVVAVCLVAGVSAASALPSYARQTGDSCSACHVSAFGPQLTPHGTAFKLHAYAESTGAWTPPVSAQAIVSYLATSKDNPASDGDPNGNLKMDELGFFLAGKIAGPVGAFAQVTYDGPGHVWGIDNVDLRAAVETEMDETPVLVGLSVNNNPGVQDPWNTYGPWRYPFNDSAFAIGPAAAPLIDGGLEEQVIGATVSAFIDNRYYVEAGAYSTPSDNFLDSTGVAPDEAAKLDGAAFYARAGYQRDWGKDNMHVGAALLSANVFPERDSSLPSDSVTDLLIDGGYQFLGNRKNIFSVQGAYTYEWRDLKGSTLIGAADRAKADLQAFHVDGTYVYDQTYEAILGLNAVWGSGDATLYAPDPVGGSRTGDPKSTSVSLEGDWTPFGKDDSYGAPYANLKLGLRLTHNFAFNGASSNYDGFGRDASDNDSVLAFLWTAL